MIIDPLFYAMAIPSVILIGLSKGGLTGLGAASTINGNRCISDASRSCTNADIIDIRSSCSLDIQKIV